MGARLLDDAVKGKRPRITEPFLILLIALLFSRSDLREQQIGRHH